jgi:hypothetical protein
LHDERRPKRYERRRRARGSRRNRNRHFRKGIPKMPPNKRAPACDRGNAHFNNLVPDHGTKTASAQEQDVLWQQLAVQHEQRRLILDALEAINSKLAALLDIAMRKGTLP